MKNLSFFVFAFFTAMSLSFFSNAQSIVIKTNDGTENIKQMTSFNLLTFSNENLVVNSVQGTTEKFSISKIKKIYFDDVVTGNNEITINDNSKELYLYPNPANSMLYFSDLPEENSLISIYRIDGTRIFQSYSSSVDSGIDVSYFSPGLYILKINNQALKFRKI